MPDEGGELEVNGRVTELLPNALFRVSLEGEGRSQVVAHVAGAAFALSRVRPGDEVVVALTAYDATRGRIVRRRG
jgi:translation initiation factor IF-1